MKGDGWVVGNRAIGGMSIPVVSTTLSWRDRLGGWRVRWGIGRSRYRVEPGLYAAGEPGGDSPVLVTANYKLSFDCLRESLGERSAWIMVLDTLGINVWCAAGKKTFGTQELIERVRSVKLPAAVSHRKLILPQLGAPGVAAREVEDETGFKVVFGPVRAGDIPEFIDNGYRANDRMRTVTFPFRERAAIAPLEFIQSMRLLLVIVPVVFLIHVIRYRGVTPGLFGEILPFLAALATGSFLTPVLLPWIPGRSLALKGWILGVLPAVLFWVLADAGIYTSVSYLLLLPPISSFLSLNFTGATTYTSLSGVVKEMQYALPLMGLSVLAGLVMKILSLFH